MANAENLCAPWQPGQTGNPAGSSAKQRRISRLRQAFDTILAEPIPDLLRLEANAELPDGIDLPAEVTFSELIALRVILVAAKAPNISDILSATGMVMGATALPDAHSPPPTYEAPILPTTEERRLSIATQLGLVKPQRKKVVRRKVVRRKKAAKKRAKK